MIKAFKRWIGKAVYDGIIDQEKNRSTEQLTDALMTASAMYTVFQIDNGFIVRSTKTDSNGIPMRIASFVYCADHQAIADHIISSAVLQKLGLQTDMFEKEKQAAIARHFSKSQNPAVSA